MTADRSAAAVLAAGASRRYGRPKLAEEVQGEPLLRRTVRVTLAARARPVLVVLGAHRELLEPCIADLGAEVVINPRWKAGMGTSLAAAVEHLLRHHTETPGVLVIPADLPRLQADHLVRLEAAARAAGKPAAATVWQGVPPQAPAWLSRELFPELLRLGGDEGARRLLRADPSRVALVRLESPLEDMDRPGDLHRPSGDMLEAMRPESRRRVVVVDDSQFQCEYWRRLLEERYPGRAAVEMYTDPREAVEHLAPDIHLMLLDWEMPQLDGKQVLEAARQACVNLKRVIITSSHPAAELHETFDGSGVLAVIEKTEPEQQAAFMLILDSIMKR